MRKSRNETVKTLRPLRRALPAFSAASVTDEDGAQRRWGFKGNCSQSPLYVTDGYILLLAAAIDPAIAIEQDGHCWDGKRATRAAIGNVWKCANNRSEVNADLIGVCDYDPGSTYEVAFLRDALGRVMVVNAHLLAFGIRAVHPDALTIDGAPIEATCMVPGQVPWFSSPLALRRAGELVGLLMPMSLSTDDFSGYDMRGEPVDICAIDV